MPAHLTTLWRMLPARLQHDPEIIALRLDHLEGRVSNLEKDWVPHPEVQMVETPVGPMPIKLVIIGLLILAIFRPDLLSKLIP
jgi:hypothetical protein